MTKLPDDFRDLLFALGDAGAEFVIVGGYAVITHGHIRTTKDIDILIRADAANAQRVFEALAAFGAPLGSLGVKASDFASPGQVLQLGLPPRRIDLLTRVEGITFDEAIAERFSTEVDGRQIPVIGLEALLKNKRSAGRDQDLLDVKALEALKKRK